MEIQFFVVRDWTLNPEFYATCKADAVRLCNVPDQFFKPGDIGAEPNGAVLPCLYHYMDEDYSGDEGEEKGNKFK